MKKTLAIVAVTIVASVAVSYYVLSGKERLAIAKASELESVVTTKEKELTGFTAYTNFLTAGKQSLSGQAKLLAASIRREEGITQLVQKSMLGFSSDATVAIWYTADYSFGYDLQPGNYDVRRGADNIEIIVSRPTMIVPAAVTNLRHKILSDGVLADAKTSVIKLQQVALENAQKQGREMTADPAVQALCEKKLIEFLHDFLKKQAGVRTVPAIKVVYR